MTGEHGGEERGDTQRLAPVIPLFGGTAPADQRKPDGPARGDVLAPGAAPDSANVVPRRTGDAGLWRSTWDGESSRNAAETNETARPVESEVGGAIDRHPARGSRSATKQASTRHLRAVHDHAVADDVAGRGESSGDSADGGQVRDAAEKALVRKLRARSLSVSEARTVLKTHALASEHIDQVIEDFCRRGYLDDAILAGHLVTSGVERKGHGRVALSRALGQRGIPRDVIEGALAELPDDDAQRALEFARTKARSLARLDFDTALRRLVGQLSRRGYAGSVAMTAARSALTEATTGPSSGGVRFTDSE